MQVKRYLGGDLRGTLARVKRELGPDALVLSHRDLSAEGGRGFEVTVGIERRRPEEADVRLALRRLADRVRCDDPVAEPQSPAPTESTTTARVRATLLGAGFGETFVDRFGRELQRRLGSAVDPSALARASVGAMERAVQFRPMRRLRATTLLVGPPGVGKTTSAFKLTASSPDGRPILACADGHAPWARSVCRQLGDAHDIDVTVIDGPEALRKLARARRDDPIVVDTAGVGGSDAERATEIQALRRATPRADVVVVLPSGLDSEEARTALRRFLPLKPTSVAVSRLDDGRRPGAVIGAAAEAGLPISFVTHGHRIPTDWTPADADVVTSAALRGLTEQP